LLGVMMTASCWLCLSMFNAAESTKNEMVNYGDETSDWKSLGERAVNELDVHDAFVLL